MPSLELLATITAGVGGARLDAGVLVDPSPTPASELAPCTLTVGDAIALATRPPAGVPMSAWVRVYVGGELVDPERLQGPWSVERRRDRSLQAWEFSSYLDTPSGTFGELLATLGNPIGRREVEIRGYYQLPDGREVEVPLLSRGTVDRPSRSSTAAGVHTETQRGSDAGARAQRRRVTVVHPPASGLRADEIVSELLAAAGEPAPEIPRLDEVRKPVQFVDADPIAAANELLAVHGRVLQWGPRGVPRAVKLRGQGRPARWSIRPSDILALSTVQVTGPGDVVTDVTVTGTEWQDGSERCGDESKSTTLTRESYYLPRRLRWRQNTDCTITDVAGAPTAEPDLRPTEVVVNTEIRRCGVVILEMVEVWRYHARQTYRYRRADVFTALECRFPAWFLDDESAPSEQGSEPAFAEPERWRRVRRLTTRKYWNLPGWTYGSGGFGESLAGVAAASLQGNVSLAWSAPDPDTGAIYQYVQRNSTRGPMIGSYLGSVSVEETYYQRRAALKRRLDPSVTWDEEVYIPTVRVLGGGDAVDDDHETFQRVRVEVESVDSTSQGRKVADLRQLVTPFARPGTEYLYSGTRTSSDAQEVLRLVQTDEQRFQKVAEGVHRVVKIHGETYFPERGRVETETVNAALPSVDLLPFFDEDLFAALGESNGQTLRVAALEAAMARSVPGAETQPIKAHVTAPALESRHDPYAVVTSYPWAETADLLARAGAILIDESAASVVTLVVPAWFTLDEADAVDLTYPPQGFDEVPVELRSVRWSSSGPSDPPVATLEGRIYLSEVPT